MHGTLWVSRNERQRGGRQCARRVGLRRPERRGLGLSSRYAARAGATGVRRDGVEVILVDSTPDGTADATRSHGASRLRFRVIEGPGDLPGALERGRGCGIGAAGRAARRRLRACPRLAARGVDAPCVPSGCCGREWPDRVPRHVLHVSGTGRAVALVSRFGWAWADALHLEQQRDRPAERAARPSARGVLETPGGTPADRGDQARRRSSYFEPDMRVTHRFDGLADGASDPAKRRLPRDPDPAARIRGYRTRGCSTSGCSPSRSIIASRTVDSWWDCMRAGRHYGLRWFELPAAFAIAVVVHLLEIGGMPRHSPRLGRCGFAEGRRGQLPFLGV